MWDDIADNDARADLYTATGFLSQQQIQVLRYTRQGYTQDEIACMLKLSRSTVRDRLRCAYDVIGAVCYDRRQKHSVLMVGE